MIIKKSEGEQILNQSGVVGTSKLKKNDLEIVHLTIEPGFEITEHLLSITVTFYIIEGSGMIILDKKSYECEKGDLILVNPGQLRSWKNHSDETLKILVIKQ